MGHVHKYDYHFGTVWVCHTFTHFTCIIWCDLAILGFIQPWLKDVKTCKGLKIFCSIFPKIMTKPWWQGNDAKIHIILKYKMIQILFQRNYRCMKMWRSHNFLFNTSSNNDKTKMFKIFENIIPKCKMILILSHRSQNTPGFEHNTNNTCIHQSTSKVFLKKDKKMIGIRHFKV